MFNHIKNFFTKIFKFIFILIVLSLFLGLLYHQYNKFEKTGTVSKIISMIKNSISNSESSNNSTEYSIPNTNTINTINNSNNILDDNNSNIDSNDNHSNKNSSNDFDNNSEINPKTYEDYYNKFVFDNVLLLYEGVQKSSNTKDALDRLIVNADDPLYSKPTVVFENFGSLTNNEITENNLEEYKRVLNQVKNSLGNGTYTFSFEYNNLKTMVNKIIITKN